MSELADPMGMREEKLEAQDPRRLFDSVGEVPESVQVHVSLVKAELRQCADRVWTLMMPSRERSLAMTKLEEASYYAHAGLIREGVQLEADGGFVEVDRRRAIRRQVEEMVERCVKLSEVYLCGGREGARELVKKLADGS